MPWLCDLVVSSRGLSRVHVAHGVVFPPLNVGQNCPVNARLAAHSAQCITGIPEISASTRLPGHQWHPARAHATPGMGRP